MRATFSAVPARAARKPAPDTRHLPASAPANQLRRVGLSNLGIVLIGGILPACLWGLTAILQKLSAQHGAGPAHYLAAFGIVIASSGLGAALWQQRAEPFPTAGIGYAALAGLCFALGTGLISFTLWRYGAPISKLAPILSCNVLVTVAIAVLVMKEGGSLDLPRLLGGTVLILVGAAFVTGA
jgi:uncharacterized membrane protein